MADAKGDTLLETVYYLLKQASRYNPNDVVAPVAVLWPDKQRQWEPIMSQLRQLIPGLLTLGEYKPEDKTGPAIWLRCVIDRVVDIGISPETTFVVYLPGVDKQKLRTPEECCDELTPLIELQYRGTLWTHRNGRDWTVEAFLVSQDALGLDVAQDRQTRESALGVLIQLAVTPISDLRGRRLEAEDFDRLVLGDTERQILMWLNDPLAAQEDWETEKWKAFCSRCTNDYGFNPELDGAIVAAEKLGLRETDKWNSLWTRYTEAPASYSNIPDQLRRVDLVQTEVDDREPWPEFNDQGEDALRQELLKLARMSPQDARSEVERLENLHAERRQWVWAKLGQSPLAIALQYLAVVAKVTAQSYGGSSPEEMAKLYIERGYLADDAALMAMDSVRSVDDARAIEAALQSMYVAWLEDTARHFQDLVARNPLPNIASDRRALVTAEPGQCLLFVDGLRYDLAKRMMGMAEEQELEMTINWRWAAFPTITLASKPSISPIRDRLEGDRPGEEFAPRIKDSDAELDYYRFNKLLCEEDYQLVGSEAVDAPIDNSARGWAEAGRLDKLGHTLKNNLAHHIDEQLGIVLDRVCGLLSSGWQEVRVITDHGWLLVPGKLPATELPKYLTESRWSRCATIRPGNEVDIPAYGWYWNPYQLIACAPGISCFVRGNAYAHGGVSLQECLIPDLVFRSQSTSKPISISEVRWVGLRCRVVTDAVDTGVTADLRTKPNDSTTSITRPKVVADDGNVSLLVEDNDFEGMVVSVVLADTAGRILAREVTTVGGDD